MPAVSEFPQDFQWIEVPQDTALIPYNAKEEEGGEQRDFYETLLKHDKESLKQEFSYLHLCSFCLFSFCFAFFCFSFGL